MSQQQKLTLSEQYQGIISRLAEVETIPSFRVDAKAKLMQSIGQDAIGLSGSLVAVVEHQGQVIHHQGEQIKQILAELQDIKDDLEVGRQLLAAAGISPETHDIGGGDEKS